jgi:hypothetical protein
MEDRGGERETSSAGQLGTFKGIVSRDEYVFEGPSRDTVPLNYKTEKTI